MSRTCPSLRVGYFPGAGYGVAGDVGAFWATLVESGHVDAALVRMQLLGTFSAQHFDAVFVSKGTAISARDGRFFATFGFGFRNCIVLVRVVYQGFCRDDGRVVADCAYHLLSYPRDAAASVQVEALSAGLSIQGGGLDPNGEGTWGAWNPTRRQAQALMDLPRGACCVLSHCEGLQVGQSIALFGTEWVLSLPAPSASAEWIAQGHLNPSQRQTPTSTVWVMTSSPELRIPPPAAFSGSAPSLAPREAGGDSELPASHRVAEPSSSKQRQEAETQGGRKGFAARRGRQFPPRAAVFAMIAVLLGAIGTLLFVAGGLAAQHLVERPANSVVPAPSAVRTGEGNVRALPVPSPSESPPAEKPGEPKGTGKEGGRRREPRGKRMNKEAERGSTAGPPEIAAPTVVGGQQLTAPTIEKPNSENSSPDTCTDQNEQHCG